jgi:nitroreductase
VTIHLSNRVDLLRAVDAAILAPSVHNTQPWLFRLDDTTIEVHADTGRRLPATDPDGKALRLSVGAATFNIRTAIAVQGWRTHTDLLPDPTRPDLIARIIVGEQHMPSPADQGLFAAIPRRHSNRRPFLDAAVPLEVRARLIDAARTENAWLELIVGHEARYLITELTRTADDVLMRDLAYLAELASWSRPEGDALDGPPQPNGGSAAHAIDLLARRDFGGPPGHPPVPRFEVEPLLAVLGAYGDSPRHDLIAGQALQRVLLTATSSGLVTSLASQAMDVPHIREQLRLGLRRPGPPQMVLHIGYGPGGHSPPRRTVAEVLMGHEDAGLVTGELGRQHEPKPTVAK